MKNYSFSILILVLITISCNSTKKAIVNNKTKAISAKKVVKNHNLIKNDKQTINAKFKSKFSSEKINQNISVDLKIIKDEVIYIKGSKFITVFKAKITPSSIAFYSPLAKNYFTGDFKTLTKILGVEVNFIQLQNLFLGKSILDLTESKNNVSIKNNSYLVTPKVQNQLFDFLLYLNSENYRATQQSLIKSIENKRLDVFYTSYRFIEEVFFPENFSIQAKKENKVSKLDFSLKSVFFNKTLSIPFSIPSNYKKITF